MRIDTNPDWCRFLLIHGSTQGRCSGLEFGLLIETRHEFYSSARPAALKIGWSDRCQPLGMFVAAAVDLIEVQTLQVLGNGAAGALADGASIHLPDRGDLRRGPGKKGLVGNVYLIAGNALFHYLYAQLVGQGQDGSAGDAVEGRGQVWGMECALPDDEDVLAAALHDIAFDIQQQCLVVAVPLGLLQGHHGIHVVAVGLGPAHDGIDLVAGEG